MLVYILAGLAGLLVLRHITQPSTSDKETQTEEIFDMVLRLDEMSIASPSSQSEQFELDSDSSALSIIECYVGK